MIIRFLGQCVYVVIVLVESALGLRFVFELIGANESNTIVRFIYDVSQLFITPFQDIIDRNLHVFGFYIDVDAIVSLVIYMIIAFFVGEIIKIFSAK